MEAFSGRGSFVAAEAIAPVEDRKDKAIRLIDQLLDQLSRLKFSAQDIRMLFDLRLLGRTEDSLQEPLRGRGRLPSRDPENLRAPIPPESPTSTWPGSTWTTCSRTPGPPRCAPGIFDLVLTTTTHFQELVDRFPEILGQGRPGGRGPDPDVHRQPRPPDPGPADRHPQRIETVPGDHPGPPPDLRYPRPPSVQTLFVSQLDRLDDFIASLDAVIVPAGYSLQKNREHLAALQAFHRAGRHRHPLRLPDRAAARSSTSRSACGRILDEPPKERADEARP
ncbi:MAG: hypothetical protein MZW92_01610 [Comamonadaceae bacterium]|nr:hypothetical protein [Comamonadaceae bacterium]